MSAKECVQSKMAEIEVYINLWAYMMREAPPTGWYKKQPWYVPAFGYRESSPEISEDDVEKAEAIGEMLNRMREKDEEGYRIIKIYYRATPNDEETTKSYRFYLIDQELGVDRREVYRRLKQIKAYLEGALAERFGK